MFEQKKKHIANKLIKKRKDIKTKNRTKKIV